MGGGETALNVDQTDMDVCPHICGNKSRVTPLGRNFMESIDTAAAQRVLGRYDSENATEDLLRDSS